MPAGIPNYSTKVAENRGKPTDPFGHGTHLLETDRLDIGSFAQLIQRDIKLANIGGDIMLRLYQNDGLLLINAYAMSTKDEVLKPVFKNLYWGWLLELNITRAKDGGEREYQSHVGGGYGYDRDISGYGADQMAMQQQEQQGGGDGGVIGGLVGGLKKLGKRR